MQKKVLENHFICTDFVTPVKIDRDELKFRIFAAFYLKKRLSDNPRDYNYEDYKVEYCKPSTWVEDYVRDHYRVQFNTSLAPLAKWGNCYHHGEQSVSRRFPRADMTWIYGVEVNKDSSSLVIEYNEGPVKDKLWWIPLETNKVIVFPSHLKYFISKNKSAEPNFFLTCVCGGKQE